MIESRLLGGAQDFSIQWFVYGRSIADACLSSQQTLAVLAKVAAAVRARRAVTS
jgi:3-deoxy-7-phosphoheptulonate synthase